MWFPDVRVIFWNWAKKLLFRWDAEKAHYLSLRIAKIIGILPPLLRWITRSTYRLEYTQEPSLKVHLNSNLCFAHPVGLAAGFDKNAELLPLAQNLGFSFIEVGTVTPRPQLGNDKPRLFRDSPHQALFNRMGFNNEGADRVALRIEKYRKTSSHSSLKIGVNIGKNKDTPLELAAQDYALLAHRFASLADYLVVNVSSPNTPGLRELQELKNLEPILRSVIAESRREKGRPCPVFLKLAPEVEGEILKDTLEAAASWGVEGFVLTNTLAGEFKGLKGGWSGAPLSSKSLKSLEYARHATDLPLISVGGIMSPQDARDRLNAGASLVQIYSGWIYHGPTFPSDIVRGLL